MLPKYRGRSPHIWAIINGEKFTGVTAHRISEIVDMGNILIQRVVPIDSDDSGGSLILKFERVYPEVIIEALEIVEHSSGSPQNENEATYYGKRTESMSYIDIQKTTVEIVNFIRALRKPYPPAYTYLNSGHRIYIESVRVSTVKKPLKSKGIFSLNEKLFLTTSDGVLEVVDYELSE
jgi:methionyl-tRNA formyltransferase